MSDSWLNNVLFATLAVSALSKGDVAVGVAAGMMAARAVPRIGGWLLWIGAILLILMVFA